jgi:N-acetylglucosamine-6-phosphate deacetylase
MTVAPELELSGASIDYLQRAGVHVALGHSNATFAEAQTAFEHGIRMVTHTYNAAPPLHHRAPGAVIASMLDDRVMNCVIADGLHVDPAAIKLLVKVKGTDKVVLVTDAAHIGTTGGDLVGSSIDLSDAVKNMVEWGVSTFQQAVIMASLNPARAMGWDNQIGKIEAGHCADLVIWDKKTLEIKMVFVHGTLVYSLDQNS